MHAPVRTARTTPRIRTAATTLLTALVIALGLPTGSTGSASAADGDVTWTVRTAANSYGDDRSSFSYAVNPGGQLKDAMVVANHGRTPLDLAVYTADGFTTDTGQLDLLTRDKKSVGVGAWIHATRATVTIKPGKSAQLPFTAKIPANAPPGDYVGGILTSLKQPDDAEGINVDRRLGIKVKLRVGGTLKPQLAVEDVHLDHSTPANPFTKGDATVTYTIHNTGNAILSARQSVAIAGPFNWLRTDATRIPAPPELLPGETWKVKVPVHGVASAIRLKATVTLTPVLTDASGSKTSLKPTEATAHAWSIPWPLLLLAAALIALLLTTLHLTRRHRANRKLREDARVQEAVEQALRDQHTPTP
ncbi:WxL protein peptidoglycan domain-containing protein [Streptomyces sp. NPDC088261]|uniref:WxL protein peptidoglycan domain-containing protein n=1 Tax=Streptomyces sp. NPDC088261 TaxID=3365851 RepID=UPI003811715C